MQPSYLIQWETGRPETIAQDPIPEVETTTSSFIIHKLPLLCCVPHTESNWFCGTERVWFAKLPQNETNQPEDQKPEMASL